MKILTLFVMLSAMAIAQPFTKTMKRLPDSGQTGDYTTARGEDSDFQINLPSFQLLGNGAVLDTMTGLMWQQGDGGEMSIENARIYCASLVLGGYSDWRLPTAQELFSIHDFSKNNPALNTAIFSRSDAEYWWSSQTLASDSMRVFCTNAGGGVGPHPRNEAVSAGGTKKFHVRAVRDVNSPINLPKHFSDNGNYTITDNATGLVWQQYCLDDSLSWEKALSAADTLSLAAFTDWRLPNVKELQSLHSVLHTLPSVELQYFPCVGANEKLWTSTTLLGQGFTSAWELQADLGIMTYQPKSARLKVLCVRGGVQSATGVDSDTDQSRSILNPNPSSGLTQLNAVYDVVVLSSTIGQRLLTCSNCDAIDVSKLSHGVYLVFCLKGSTELHSLLVKE